MLSNNKLQQFKDLTLSSYQFVQQKYKDFRLYDLGGLAVNGLISKQGYRLTQDLAYGDKDRQRFDLYKTEQSAKSLILFVHGGAWAHGDKSAYKFVGEAFARSGHDVAVVNYHLAPEHIFPSYIDDLVVALNYLELNQTALGISTEKIILLGHSAGAFNIASLLYHPQPHELACREHIKALIGIAGPYHFDYKGDALAEGAFDVNVHYQQVMPYYFVEHNDIQHYLLLAEQDKIVKHSNSYDFKSQLDACHNHCEIITIPKTGHISIMGSVSSLFSRFFQTKPVILKVIDQALAQ